MNRLVLPGAVLSGLLFGAGLVIGGMTDPLKVLGFLDVTGSWNPTLAFVMGGALLVTFPAFALAKRRQRPLADLRFHLPEMIRIDRRLLAGAALFGIGWGLAGYGPGPAIAGLGLMWHELVWLLPAYAVGTWLADLETGKVLGSDATATIHGEPPGHSPTITDGIQYYAPEYRTQISNVFDDCVNHGLAYDEILQIVTTAGKRVWVRAIGEPVHDEAGKVRTVRGAFQDISELVKAKEESQRLSERLRDTLESISDAFFLLDTHWRFAFLNRSAERLLNRSAPELLGRLIWDAFAESVGTPFETEYRRAVEEQRSVSFQAYYPPLEAWFDVNADPSAEGLAVYFRDITAQLEQRRQLTVSEERFRIISQATADVIWDWDIAADTIWWNEGMRTLFGYDLDVVSPDSSSWVDRIHPADRDRVLKSLRAVIISGENDWSAEYRFLRHDDSVALVTDRGFVMRDDTGWATRMLGSMVDVTQQRGLEEQLRQSQRLDVVGQLTGGIAHDFNNLLTVILGNAEMLSLRLANDAALQKLADETRSAAERGAELTSRLLAFSKRHTLKPRATDVKRLIDDMHSLLQRTLGEQIEFSVAGEAAVRPALVDKTLLESAVLNLCINARDAMPTGGHLVVEAKNAHLDATYATRHTEVEPGNYVAVSVTDDGSGMDDATLARVFEPFFTTKEVGKGSGLGLSMVYGFVTQSRGHVRVVSEPGSGTTVTMYLPVAAGEAADEAVIAEEDATPSSAATAKILLVEDDDLVRSHVEAQLAGLGYRVVSARNGAEALQELQRTDDFDLLFTDIVMPGEICGRQLAEGARALHPDLPVLFTSGYTEHQVVKRDASNIQLLEKPYRRQALAAKLHAVLSHGPAKPLEQLQQGPTGS